MFTHVSVGNKFLRESVTDLALVIFLEAQIVISIHAVIYFANSVDTIWIQVTEVILCAAARDLARYKNRGTRWR